MTDPPPEPPAVALVRAGLALVPIPRGKKGPTASGWQTEAAAIRTEDQAAKLNGGNIGIAHRWCGTCCIDVDDYERAVEWLHTRGIDLVPLLTADDAVQIHSGRPNRAKLLYRLPPGVAWLPTRQPTGSGLEFRCATDDGTATVQDVLPPSLHPDTGKPYEWRGDFTAIPVLPDALLALWRSLERAQQRQEQPGGRTFEREPGVEDWLAELLSGGDLHNNARALIGRMAQQGVEEAAILAWFTGVRPALEAARGTERVRDFFDGELQRLVSGARKFRDEAPGQTYEKNDWQKLAEALTVTNEHVREIEEAAPIWLQLIWHQKYHVWCAPPNAGKTAIAREAAAALAASGYEVYYFNLDAGADDIKHHHAHAERHGYRLLAPLSGGASDDDATRVIDAMLAADDLASVVLFLDTLKKFADLLSKRAAPAFYKKLRALTRRGCTVVALAHTTKFKTETGELVPDGVGDLKNDCDMLMFLYHLKDEATGDLTVSTKFDKERALTADATFHICRATRAVTLQDGYCDTQQEAALRNKEAADRTLIDFLMDRLPANQTQLIAAAKEALSAGRRTVERVLRLYVGRHWTVERAVNFNERRYRRLP